MEVLAQQIRADLERIDGGTGTASSSHTAGATGHKCYGGHGQATHAGNPTERSAGGGDERNLDRAQHEGIEKGSRTVRTFRRATDVVENLRVPMESLPHRSGQEVSRARGQNRRHHQRRSQRRSGPRESGTEHAAVLCSGPCIATRECGGVDREKRKPRRSCRGMETDSGRVTLRQRRETFSPCGPSSLRFPQGSDIVVGIKKMEEDMTRYQKMAGENLSDTIKVGILVKVLTNEAELQKHVLRNSTRFSTCEKMREEVMSAVAMVIGAVGKSGKKGTGKKGKGKNDQKGRGKAQAKRKTQELRTKCRARVLLLPPQGPRQRGMQNPYVRREGQQEQGRERQENGQTFQAKGEEMSECVGRSRARKPGNEQQQHQSRRGSGHSRRVAGTHDL